ncbi:BlaI family penicillinase repressor [Clostridium saccharoperbutylacetonicum]|jgi:BlaI family penicillinase repressor|uniref:Penicillinase repressor BlaI n=1 Tax=Clostridium saccharoperbutylacetonicum N1-4(HMT) TaxID=931276 RepID=M1MKN3_9CLOT|nr:MULTISPECIES: CopY/TcrY family copper transport repressor [Clostridium]AGF55376.1 penicillinase repressor BlaI [Clostridium saccharoperbutylacetonicum N1-4(HMT)]NRT63911.1 BlaI family penicillinase repressor [Clostridium saccharoperbutylacetonicum]NSB27277.1 BlaI family penicillinase repressor [Clostridium saccharoperbutylacetonicum]NSB40763.1 BlaI family penicillinase repressor [Clostridium saccharoperbutylacetonicum]
MEEIPKISEAEWEVMKIVWSEKLCTSNQIIEALENIKDWKPKTIKTLISRLVSKNALGFKEEGRKYLYYPLINENECIHAENQTFLSKVYNGAIKNMLVSFIKESDLSKEDIEDLKSILDERNK